MQTEQRSEHLGNVERVVSGSIVDSGPDHLTVRDFAANDEITVRIDDRTLYSWQDKRQEGRLTEDGQVHVSYYIAGGIHMAAEVLVLDPGNGPPLSGRFASHAH